MKRVEIPGPQPPIEVLAGAEISPSREVFRGLVEGRAYGEDGENPGDSPPLRVLKGKAFLAFRGGGETIVVRLRRPGETSEYTLNVPLPRDCPPQVENEISNIMSALLVALEKPPKEGYYHEIIVAVRGISWQGNTINPPTLRYLSLSLGRDFSGKKPLAYLETEEGNHFKIFPSRFSFLGIFWGVRYGIRYGRRVPRRVSIFVFHPNDIKRMVNA